MRPRLKISVLATQKEEGDSRFNREKERDRGRRERERGRRVRAKQRHIEATFTPIPHLAAFNKCPYCEKHGRGPINTIQRACIKN